MYYKNKLDFYFEQYGTQIVLGIICLIIIASGLFVYLKINNKAHQSSTVISGNVENNTQTNTEPNVTEDETILPDNLKALEVGQRATVKIATVDDKGVLILISGDKRINAKMIGTDVTEKMPDTIYIIDQDLSGKYVEISFDETKVSNGYAMIYVYSDETTLYNAKLLKDGKLILDSSISKKSLEYNKLAESQAYAKQNLTGVWEH